MVRFTALLDAKLLKVAEEGWNADSAFVEAVPKPSAVLAASALVAPVPPRSRLNTPTTLEALKFVRFTALLDARLLNTPEEGWNADAGLVAAVPSPSPVRALDASTLQKLVGLTTALLLLTRTFRVCE